MRISDWSSDVCSSDLPQRHAVSVTPLSNSDPSQAPEGGSLAYVYLPGIAVDAREGWSPELKDRTMKSVIDHMSEFYEGFESEVGRFVESAREREKRDRKSVGYGKIVSVRVDLGGRWIIKNKTNTI